MEGDLTLQLIGRALASGLLYQFRIDPFDTADILRLKYILEDIQRNLCLQYSSRELQASLVSKICMAIGNREQFKSVNEDMIGILTYLRGLDFPDKRKEKSLAVHDSIIALWERVFGDPEEVERQHAERMALAGEGESDVAQVVRGRQKYVRSHFLRP